MDILYVILTALLVVAAVTMILKKVDTRLTFLFLGVIGLAAKTRAGSHKRLKQTQGGRRPFGFAVIAAPVEFVAEEMYADAKKFF